MFFCHFQTLRLSANLRSIWSIIKNVEKFFWIFQNFRKSSLILIEINLIQLILIQLWRRSQLDQSLKKLLDFLSSQIFLNYLKIYAKFNGTKKKRDTWRKFDSSENWSEKNGVQRLFVSGHNSANDGKKKKFRKFFFEWKLIGPELCEKDLKAWVLIMFRLRFWLWVGLVFKSNPNTRRIHNHNPNLGFERIWLLWPHSLGPIKLPKWMRVCFVTCA